MTYSHFSEKPALLLRKKAGLSSSKKDWKIPRWKRIFDILGASVLILLLFPLYLLVGILVKLESRGPVFYVSKRIGQGYQVFDFYKFRSMRAGAGNALDDLKNLNQYAVREEEGVIEVKGRGAQLFSDKGAISEDQFQVQKEREEGSTFIKIKNDPRITRVGRIIRSTSIDELPQLFNVLKGDMSLVGNRPLPLYEAEKLTQDEAVLRFKAPAGITGLWQVKGRGKAEVSEEERKQFDIEYAENYSFWMDLRILWKTLPAAVQEANV
jgi:lipopolysaccharide/colanic/teichoic acid biosynthesis glycosyltransferase